MRISIAFDREAAPVVDRILNPGAIAVILTRTFAHEGKANI